MADSSEKRPGFLQPLRERVIIPIDVGALEAELDGILAEVSDAEQSDRNKLRKITNVIDKGEKDRALAKEDAQRLRAKIYEKMDTYISPMIDALPESSQERRQARGPLMKLIEICNEKRLISNGMFKTYKQRILA